MLLAGAQMLPLAVWFVCGATATACGAWSLARRRHNLCFALLFVAFVCGGATLAGQERGGIGADRVRRIIDENRVERNVPVEITGVIEGAPEPMPDGFAVVLRVERLRAGRSGNEEREASGRVRLFASVSDRETLRAYENLELRTGARVRLMTLLRRAEEFRNPGVESRIASLDRDRIDATATIKSPLLIERMDDERVFLPLWWLARWRAHALARTHELFEPHTAGLLGAMLLGHDRFITRDTGERFRAGGTYHVLVISGMHITIVGFVALFLTNRFTRRPAVLFLVPTAAAWIYAIAVGAEVSVVRAAVMFTFVALAPALGRDAHPSNTLGAAALVLLAWQPSALFDPSFQLTFLSVFAIVCVALPLLTRLREAGEWRPSAATPYPPACPAWWRALGEALHWDQRGWQEDMRRAAWTYNLRKASAALWLNRLRLQVVLRYAFSAVVVSACVQLVMLPLLVVLFHRVSVISLLFNLIVGIGMIVVTTCALSALVIAEVSGTLAAFVARVTDAAGAVTTHAIDPFINIGAMTFRTPAYEDAAKIVYALYYVPLAFLIVALLLWRVLPRSPHERQTIFTRRRSLFIAAMSLALITSVILAHPRGAEATRGRLRIDFLDVNQGDAALVTMPDGTTLLIDGGGRPSINRERASRGASHVAERGGDEGRDIEYDRRSVGEAVVSEYLWWRGLSKVDYLVATHADTDHIDGLNAVARNFRVRAAFVGRDEAGDEDYEKFINTLDARRIPVHDLDAGDVLRFGDARIEIINSPSASDTGKRRGNDDSVVLRIVYGNRRILLTGDIEERAERLLVATRGDALRSDVVKVAHHGSRTSSSEEFISRAGASLAVISVGRESPYNHPHEEVVERWQASGARVLTTGGRGTITVSTDGEDLRVETFVGENEK